MTERLSGLAALVLSSALAILLAYVSGNLDGRFEHKAESAALESAILARQPFVFDGGMTDFPEFRNRLLMPALTASSASVFGGTRQQWFILWRVLSAAAMFVVWFWTLRDVAWPRAVLGAAALFVVLVASFDYFFEVAIDFPDVAFTLGFCALVRAGMFPALGLLALIGATNRESAAFAGVLWACVHGWTDDWRIRWRGVVEGAALSVVVYGEVLLLRHAFAATMAAPRIQMLGLFHVAERWRAFLQHPSPSGWPVLLAAVIAPIGLWLIHSARTFTPTDRRYLAAASIILVVTLVFGILTEIRVWLPVFAVVIVVLTRADAAPHDAQGAAPIRAKAPSRLRP